MSVLGQADPQPAFYALTTTPLTGRPYSHWYGTWPSNLPPILESVAADTRPSGRISPSPWPRCPVPRELPTNSCQTSSLGLPGSRVSGLFHLSLAPRAPFQRRFTLDSLGLGTDANLLGQLRHHGCLLNDNLDRTFSIVGRRTDVSVSREIPAIVVSQGPLVPGPPAAVPMPPPPVPMAAQREFLGRPGGFPGKGQQVMTTFPAWQQGLGQVTQPQMVPRHQPPMLMPHQQQCPIQPSLPPDQRQRQQAQIPQKRTHPQHPPPHRYVHPHERPQQLNPAWLPQPQPQMPPQQHRPQQSPLRSPRRFLHPHSRPQPFPPFPSAVSPTPRLRPPQPPGRAPGNTNTPLFPPLQQTLSSPPHPHHLTTTTAAATTTATNPPRSPKSLLPPFPSKGPRPRLHHRARHRAHPRLNRPSHSLPVCRVHPLRPGAHEAPAPWSEPCCFAGGTVDGGLIFVWGVAGFVGVSYEGEGCSVPSLSGG